MKAQTRIAFTDEEILNSIHQAQPDLVPIDAPLSLPKGRKTIHERSGEHLRDCDRELQRRKIRFFPITLGPMRMLTERGLALKAHIEAVGVSSRGMLPRRSARYLGNSPSTPRSQGAFARTEKTWR
jgi:predicted nuclease with RNAse H fold